MKAKNYLAIISYKKNNKSVSIIESAMYMADFLIKMGDKFDDFRYPVYYHNNKRIEISLDVKTEQLSKVIAEQILHKEWNEITKFEGNKNPSIEYKRTFPNGFSGWFSFLNNNGDLLFDCSIGYGYQTNGIVISPKSKDIKFEYDWYQNVFKEVIQILKPNYCTVRVSIPSVTEIVKEYHLDYPIGWLTYYSNDLGINLSSLPNVTIEPFEGGTMIKTDEIDFLEDKESFESYKSRLRLILAKVKEANLTT